MSVLYTARPDDRTASPSSPLAFVAGMLLLTLAIMTTSRAAFTDVTDNTGSSFSAGSVELVDDDAGAALFTVTDMTPGQSAAACITVTYAGTLDAPGEVRLYSGGYTGSVPLADALRLTVEEGTGGQFGACDGFAGTTIVDGTTLDGFATTSSSHATGAGDWTPSDTAQQRTYRVTVELDADASNTLQGEQVTDATFVWEIRG